MIFCYNCDKAIKPCLCGIWWCRGFKHGVNRADGSGSHFCFVGDIHHRGGFYIAEPGDS